MSQITTNSIINEDLREDFTSFPTGISVSGHIKRYSSYEEMINDRNPSRFGWLDDATGDPTVKTGGALYRNADGKWSKLFETEMLDLSLEEILGLIRWDKVEGRPTSPVEDIDDAVTKRHVHDNNEVLDHISETTTGELVYKNRVVWNQNAINGILDRVGSLEYDLDTHKTLITISVDKLKETTTQQQVDINHLSDTKLDASVFEATQQTTSENIESIHTVQDILISDVDQLKADVKTHSGLIGDVTVRMSNIDNTKADVSVTNKLREDLDVVLVWKDVISTYDFEQMQGDINWLKGVVGQLISWQGEVDISLSQLNSITTAHGTDIVEIKSQLNQHNTAIDATVSEINIVATKVDKNTTDIAELFRWKEDLTSIDVDLAQLKEQVNLNTNDLNTHQQRLDAIDVRVDAHEQTTATNLANTKAELVDMINQKASASDIADINNTLLLKADKNVVEGMRVNVNDLVAWQITANEDINALDSRVAALENREEVDPELERRISKNEEDIAQLKATLNDVVATVNDIDRMV